MIGLRQDPLLQKECKKNRRYHALTMPSDIRGAVDDNGQHHANHESETSPRDATTSDADGTETKSVELQAEAFVEKADGKSTVMSLAERDEGEVTEDIGTSVANNQHAETEDVAKRNLRQQHPSNRNPTKIKLYNADNSWKSLLRDVMVALVPLFILFKISTHSTISNIGNSDPNDPKKLSQADVWEQVLYGLHLKKRQEELQKEYHFLEAMDGERECHDYPTIDTSAKMKQSSSSSRQKKKKRRGGKKSQQQRSGGQTKNKSPFPKRKMGKQNRPMARRRNDSPSAAPLMSSIASAFRGDVPGNVNKGTETAKQRNDQETNDEGGGKKGNRRKVGGAKKKKIGWLLHSKK